MLRRLTLLGVLSMAGIAGAIVLQSSSGYHLTPPVLTQVQAMSKNVDAAQTQVKATEQKLSALNEGYNRLVRHINDDVNIYNQVLPQLQGSGGGGDGSSEGE